jgi:hypothetical protein
MPASPYSAPRAASEELVGLVTGFSVISARVRSTTAL